MWRTSLQRMKSSVSHARSSADKPVNRTPGSSPVWQQPLNEISSYFRELELVTPHDWGFTMLSEAHCGRMLIKKCHCSASTETKRMIRGMNLTLSERVLHECSHVLLEVHPVTFNEVWERQTFPRNVGKRPPSAGPKTFCSCSAGFSQLCSVANGVQDTIVHFVPPNETRGWSWSQEVVSLA